MGSVPVASERVTRWRLWRDSLIYTSKGRSLASDRQIVVLPE
jgi:hypothetical protein